MKHAACGIDNTTYVEADNMHSNTDVAHEMLSCTLLHISPIDHSSVMVGRTPYTNFWKKNHQLRMDCYIRHAKCKNSPHAGW